jgi:ribosome recycling factor
MIDDIVRDSRESMEKAVKGFERDLTKIRTGRASLAMLDGIRVEYYGTPTPLNQVAALNVADPRLITIKPWDKSLITDIEKAIVASNLGITPASDGELIRLPIPPLTGERRKDLVKVLKKQTEEARVVVRNLRRDANALLKELDGIPEDAQHRALKECQDLTDRTVERVDKLSEAKEKDIMEV